jgi:hypothetical protein
LKAVKNFILKIQFDPNAVVKSFYFLANFNSVWSGYKISKELLDLTKSLIRFVDLNCMTFDTLATRNTLIVLCG